MAAARRRLNRQHLVDGGGPGAERRLGYSVAKAGIDNFTRWLAVEMARKHGDGVRVNADRAGILRLHAEPRGAREAGRQLHRPRARDHRQTPMGRFGRPEELVGRRPMAVQRRRLVRDRSRHPGGRRVQRVQRSVNGLWPKASS